jgi:hypothetical protein
VYYGRTTAAAATANRPKKGYELSRQRNRTRLRLPPPFHDRPRHFPLHTRHLEQGTMLTASRITGPGQALGNTPSNMFQVQQQNNGRTPLGTNRLQNGKLGEETRNTHDRTCVADCVYCRRRTSSVGVRCFCRTHRRRTRATGSASTNKRRTCIELCASYGKLAASHAAQP